jgi:uncharacterized protein YukE
MPLLPDGKSVTASVSPQVAPPTGPQRIVPLDTPPSLQVQFDQVDSVARLFEENALKLSDLVTRGQEVLEMRPMADDDVSISAAEGFTAAGRTHLAAIMGYRDWLEGIARSLRTSAAQYQSTDNNSAGTFRGVAGG